MHLLLFLTFLCGFGSSASINVYLWRVKLNYLSLSNFVDDACTLISFQGGSWSLQRAWWFAWSSRCGIHSITGHHIFSLILYFGLPLWLANRLATFWRLKHGQVFDNDWTHLEWVTVVLFLTTRKLSVKCLCSHIVSLWLSHHQKLTIFRNMIRSRLTSRWRTLNLISLNLLVIGLFRS